MPHDGSGLINAPRCSAINREGNPCRQPAMKNGKCRTHGGKVPVGIRHGKFTTGSTSQERYKEAIGDPHLLERYVTLINDPELLNLSTEIAVTRSHVIDVVQRLTRNGESNDRWKRAVDAYNRFIKARQEKAGARYQQALVDMEKVFREHEGDRILWEDFHESMKTLERLVKTENRRRASMHAMMSTEQAVGMLARIVAIIQDNVTDENSLKRIHKEFRSILIENPSLAGELAVVDARKDRSRTQERFFREGDLPAPIEAIVME
jgi:hypothetical protein